MVRVLILLVFAAAVVVPTFALKRREDPKKKEKADKAEKSEPPSSITAAAVNKADITFADVEKTLKKDQKLTVDEFATFCTANGVPWFKCKKVFEDADTDKNNVVSAAEWKKLRPDQKDDARASFDSLNFNGDKSVSKPEWDAYCQSWMTPKPTKAQCNDLFKAADTNNNDMLDKAEFAKVDMKSVNASDTNAYYNKCWWAALLLVVSCCLIPAAAHFLHMKGQSPEAKSMGIAGKALGVVGCLIPFCVCVYLLWWTNIGSQFMSNGFSTVGKLCGILVIWACLYACLAIVQIAVICFGGALGLAGKQ